MIVYSLSCAAGHVFETWFRDSSAYDAQAKRGAVICPQCGSREVTKAIMAPNLAKGGKAEPEKGAGKTGGPSAKLKKMMTDLREHVEKNFDYVGERFPEEARRIYYGETEHRSIYGEATLAEAKELKEEGVPVAPLPSPSRRND